MHLRGQKRGMAEEKWDLSTSRTGIPLQRHKTVYLRHLMECFPKSLHLTTQQQLQPYKCFREGSMWNLSTRVETKRLFCCCYSSKFLATSAQELWWRLTMLLNFQLCPIYCPRQICCDRWCNSSNAYRTHTQTHPLWGPADSFLPTLGAGTSSRSDSNTEGTEQSLEKRQQKKTMTVGVGSSNGSYLFIYF